MHQAKCFLSSQISSEPARHFVTTVASLDVRAEHSAAQVQEEAFIQPDNRAGKEDAAGAEITVQTTVGNCS